MNIWYWSYHCRLIWNQWEDKKYVDVKATKLRDQFIKSMGAWAILTRDFVYFQGEPEFTISYDMTI